MDGSIQQPPPLTDQNKQDWNRFIDFTEKEGFKGNPVLDDKDKHIGMYLMQKYKALNPKSTITYQDVPRVQQELQNYRATLVDQSKKGLIQPTPDIKSEADIMPNLSPVDGWLGSKTSSHKFPVAQSTAITNGKAVTTDFGTDTKKFDSYYLAKKGK